MRNTFYIILLLLFLSPISESRAWESFEVDTAKLDAIDFDRDAYDRFKSKREFDYYKEPIQEPDRDSKFREWLYRLLRKLFRHDMTNQQLNVVLIISLILLALLVAFLIYRFKPGLFYRNKKLNLDYFVEDEEGVDPDKKMREAIDAGDYSEAIRWNYRKLLAILHDKNIISYDSNKTVNEYVNEIGNTELKTLFRRQSVEFIFYRYGNGNANKEVYDSFNTRNEALITRLK